MFCFLFLDAVSFLTKYIYNCAYKNELSVKSQGMSERRINNVFYFQAIHLAFNVLFSLPIYIVVTILAKIPAMLRFISHL